MKRRRTGDGRVPFEGAVPQFLTEENLVCVTPDDSGYWEVQDRMLSGFHGILPNMDMLHRMVAAHLSGREARQYLGPPSPRRGGFGMETRNSEYAPQNVSGLQTR